jgi:hypothetical protein
LYTYRWVSLDGLLYFSPEGVVRAWSDRALGKLPGHGRGGTVPAAFSLVRHVRVRPKIPLASSSSPAAGDTAP